MIRTLAAMLVEFGLPTTLTNTARYTGLMGGCQRGAMYVALLPAEATVPSEALPSTTPLTYQIVVTFSASPPASAKKPGVRLSVDEGPTNPSANDFLPPTGRTTDSGTILTAPQGARL